MKTPHAVSAHFAGRWDEARFARWCATVRGQLDAPSSTLGILFLTPDYFEVAGEALEVARLNARLPLLIGASASGLVVDGQELEGAPGASLQIFNLPGAQLKACHIDSGDLAAIQEPADWSQVSGVSSRENHGWIVFGEPFQFDGETWLRQWNSAYPGRPTVGALASGPAGEARAQVYLNGDVFEGGLVALSVGGNVGLEALVSQGCTPIGLPWTVTRADRHFILTIGNRPAYSVLEDTFNGLSKEDQARAQGNLFVGFASSEYREEHRRGDFLVRNLLGADPQHGVLAVGALPRPGQTIQFQRRDPVSATEDMVMQLDNLRPALAGRTVYGGLLTVCQGRGRRLFGRPNHDAGWVQKRLGPLPVSGFFGSGEIGPVGGRTFLHGFTACLGLFTRV